MRQQDNNEIAEQQRRNMQIAEDRSRMLDTIRDLIDIELDRRGVSDNGNNRAESPSPTPYHKEPSDTLSDGSRAYSRRSLWQRILNIFTTGL